MVVHICGVTGLYQKWFPGIPISDSDVEYATDEVAEYFHSNGLDTEIESDRDFWLECSIIRPYLYFALDITIGQYTEGLDKILQTGANMMNELLEGN